MTGMDLAAAAYEWDHARQLMAIRMAEAAGQTDRDALAARHLRARVSAGPPAALGDRPRPAAGGAADRRTRPRRRAVRGVPAGSARRLPAHRARIRHRARATTRPVVVITSNRTREVHDAIRRRCLYHWVDYPDAARERAILARKAPRVPGEAVGRGGRLRAAPARRGPVQAARRGRDDRLGRGARPISTRHELAPAAVDETLGVLLKYQDDIAKVRGAEAARLVAEAQAGGGAGQSVCVTKRGGRQWEARAELPFCSCPIPSRPAGRIIGVRKATAHERKAHEAGRF